MEDTAQIPFVRRTRILVDRYAVPPGRLPVVGSDVLIFSNSRDEPSRDRWVSKMLAFLIIVFPRHY
jgi:hypothetical protein